MFRQHVLIIAVPMTPIVIANDFVQAYAREIRHIAFDLLWADQALLVLIAGGVFLMAPVMLCHIWHTRPLPPGELRDRLEKLCRRIGLRYRHILIWESDGMVVNAAVMGLFKPVRYILLSDGLLEMMDDRKIEAVFGHEGGHIKLRHIQYYLLFAVCSMLAVGGIMELSRWMIIRVPGLSPLLPVFHEYMQVLAMGLIVLIWAFGFGALSRRFEWQADLFGALSVTPPAEACNQFCIVHGTALPSPAPPARRGLPVCATSARLFADALHRIAVLNGIPVEARSWRHSSIANRMQQLKTYGYDPTAAARLERSVLAIKTFLLTGTIVGLAIAVWLYWPANR
jgi:STE24 endopeptidase